MKEKKIWEQSDEINSHLKFGKHIEKNINLLNDLLSQANVSKNDLNHILDWGPGGGWLSRDIGGRKLFLFDVVENHELIQRKNCKDKFEQIEFYDVSGENYPSSLNYDIDIAIMFSVIYHMPSLEYVKNAMEQLNIYKPKYIAIRNVFTDENNWECSEFEKNTFLRMNVMNVDKFAQLLPEYEIIGKLKRRKATFLNNIKCFSQSFIFKRIEK